MGGSECDYRVSAGYLLYYMLSTLDTSSRKLVDDIKQVLSSLVSVEHHFSGSMCMKTVHSGEFPPPLLVVDDKGKPSICWCKKSFKKESDVSTKENGTAVKEEDQIEYIEGHATPEVQSDFTGYTLFMELHVSNVNGP